MGEEEDNETEEVNLVGAIISFITDILNGTGDNDDSEAEEDVMDGSGGMNEEEDGSGMPEEEGEENEENSTTTFGGFSVSLHPIDLAQLFVQVQQVIGVNCTCVDDAMTEEMITNTTMKLMKDRNINVFKVNTKTEKKRRNKPKKNKTENKIANKNRSRKPK